MNNLTTNLIFILLYFIVSKGQLVLVGNLPSTPCVCITHEKVQAFYTFEKSVSLELLEKLLKHELYEMEYYGDHINWSQKSSRKHF